MASPKLRAFRGRLLYRALVAVTAIGGAFSFRTSQRLGRILGGLAWHFARRERAKALANLAIAFPDWTERQRRSTAHETFRHLGTSLFEIGQLWRMDDDAQARETVFDGVEILRTIVESGRTGVVFTAHCGNWEWLGSAIATMGLPISVVQRERDEPEVNTFITTFRQRKGMALIDRGSASAGRELVAALRKPGLLGFLIDQSLRVESVRVPFFGRDALTPIGPARLAIRAEAFAIPVLVERLPDGRHHIRCLEAIECRRSDDPVELTARMTRAIEEQIRRAPAQWVWMHNRWKYREKWDVAPERTRAGA